MSQISKSVEECAARAQDGPRLVPVGIGNTVALAMEEQCDKWIALQREEAGKEKKYTWLWKWGDFYCKIPYYEIIYLKMFL